MAMQDRLISYIGKKIYVHHEGNILTNFDDGILMLVGDDYIEIDEGDKGKNIIPMYRIYNIRI